LAGLRSPWLRAAPETPRIVARCPIFISLKLPFIVGSGDRLPLWIVDSATLSQEKPNGVVCFVAERPTCGRAVSQCRAPTDSGNYREVAP
jgi:hypothetical protein